MPIPPVVIKCYKYVDAHRQQYIEELQKIVAIPNISSDTSARCHLSSLIKWMITRLKNLGFVVELRETGKYTPDGHAVTVKIPTVILGTLGKYPDKKVLLYYCHLDVLKVQPDKWTTNPFILTERNGKLYGRGTAKMKGPLLCFLHAIECYQALGLELPVNIKIICESMNECQSIGLPQTLCALKTGFLSNIDCILITDSHWIGRQYPCILHGFRGVCYFNISIDGLSHDLHSGEYGGIVYEPLQDMIFLLNNLVDPFGRIKIPGFYNDVLEMTPDEEAIFHKLKINLEEYKEDAGIVKLIHDGNVTATLMHVWRYPSFNLHYINTTIRSSCPVSLSIPKAVHVRFSIWIVPYQSPEKVSEMVFDYLNKLLKQRNTPNNVTINVEKSSKPWYDDHNHWNYKAAKIATKQVYKEEANLIREGNGFPIILELHKVLPDKNILLLPLVNSEANIHSEDENISLQCYVESTKLLANYFYHLKVCAHDKHDSDKRDIRYDTCNT